MRKPMLAGAIVLAATGAGAAIVAAQEPVPTLTIAVAKSKATITGVEAVRSGPVRILIQAVGGGERFVGILEAKPGVTRAQVSKAVKQPGPPSDVEKVARIVAAGGAFKGRPYATTIPVRARDYYVVDFSRSPAVRGVFRPGSPAEQPAVAPQPDASISLRDFRITGDRVLPARGVVKIQNRGTQPHELLAFPLRKGASGKRALRYLRTDREKKLNALLAGPPNFLTLGSKKTTNRVEVRLKRGRYALVCFLPNARSKKGTGHNELGMERIASVR